MRALGAVVRLAALLVPWTFWGAVAPGATASAGASADRLSAHPIGMNAGWRSYVEDPPRLIYPQRVQVVGDAARVQNPTGLERPGGGATTIRATGAGSPALVLDLGRDAGGLVQVKLTATDGTTVRLGYSEQRQYLTSQGDGGNSLGEDDDPDGRTDTITTGGRPITWTSPATRGAQRWLWLQLDGAGSVSIDYVRLAVNQFIPRRSEYVGHFFSSDPGLNRAWWASAYTFNVDSARDTRQGGNRVVMDGGKRDRLVWLGDLAIEGPLAYYSSTGAIRIVHDSVGMFACQQYPNGYLPMASELHYTCPRDDPGAPNGPPQDPHESPLIRNGRLGEYTPYWVIDVATNVLYTGNLAFGRKMLPVIRRALAFTAGYAPGGLYVTCSQGPEINWHPFDAPCGEDAHTNAVWFRALRAAATLEREVGDRAQAAADDAQAARVRSAMMGALWDGTAGAFRNNTSDPLADHAQDANVEAVLAGVVTGSQAISALAYVREHMTTRYGRLTTDLANDEFMQQYISPFISSDELLARFRLGQDAEALALLRAEWGHMVQTDPGGTVWEKFSADGSPVAYNLPIGTGIGVPPSQSNPAGATSLAHGWGGGPVEALSGYVAGLRPLKPGWRTWEIAPHPAGLRFAQAQAYTPRGPISVLWRRGSGDRSFTVTLSAPAGSAGHLIVPTLGRSPIIAMDGRVVWRGNGRRPPLLAAQVPRGVAFYNLRGRHTFAWAIR